MVTSLGTQSTHRLKTYQFLQSLHGAHFFNYSPKPNFWELRHILFWSKMESAAVCEICCTGGNEMLISCSGTCSGQFHLGCVYGVGQVAPSNGNLVDIVLMMI